MEQPLGPLFPSVLRELAFGEGRLLLGAGRGSGLNLSFSAHRSAQCWLPSLLPEDSAVCLLLSFPHPHAWILASIPRLPSRSSKPTQCSLALPYSCQKGLKQSKDFHTTEYNSTMKMTKPLLHSTTWASVRGKILSERCKGVCTNSI